MAKSLAELSQSPHVGLAEQVYPICVAGKIAAQWEEARAKMAVAAEADPKGRKPGRVGAKKEVRELAEEADRLRGIMNDHLVAVRFRAKETHEWRAWVGKHPPREGEKLDQKTGLNFDALVDALGDFVVALNDEPVTPGYWDFVRRNAPWGDLKNAASVVFNLNETAVDIPKSLVGLLSDLTSSDDSD